jgi:hypothetical protein
MPHYIPDCWVILKVDHKGEIFYKILAGWSGSYLNGDSWRLNSGINKAELDGDYYSFHSASGSVYKCHKDGYGLRMATIHIWENIKQKYPEYITLEDDCDWSQKDWTI